MRLTSPSVQRLLNASERTLVESASASALKELSAARLRRKIERTRRLKDKYAGLARTRGRAGRGKASSTAATKRTDRETMAAKAEVFDIVLTRFLGQLAKLVKKAARPATKPAIRAPKPALRTATKTARKASSKKTAKKSAKKVARKTTEPPPPMTKGRAREIVAKVRRRVALKAGNPAAALDDVEAPAAVPEAVSTAITSAEAHDFQAHRADVEHSLAVSHITRAQGFAGSITQRTQAKRDE